MKKKLFTCLTLSVIGLFCVSGSALALPMLDGGIGMTGSFIPVNSVGDAVSFADSTGIQFDGSSFLVTTATGDFASLDGQNGTINDFSFDSAPPVTPLWTIEDVSFTMTTLDSEKISLDEDSYNIGIYGEGVVTATGFEDTPGYWNFTGQSADEANFSWSASSGSSAAPVPEPATLFLLGTGMVGFVTARRKKMKRSE